MTVADLAVPARRTPGEAGTWVFLFGDLIVFAAFFATFLHNRAQDPRLFDTSRQTLDLTIGLTNTLVLLASSLLVVTGVRAMRVESGRLARRFFALALVCGLAFMALKAVEYTAKVEAGHGPSQNSFYLYYFILTGLHLFHVLIGCGGLAFLISQAMRTDLSPARTAAVESAACFWHLVDLLWIMLFPLLYLVS